MVRLLAVVAGVLALAIARQGFANEIRVPITIDYLTLTEGLRHDLYTLPGGRAPLWNGSDACQFLDAENPSFARGAAGVKLETSASLGLGVGIAGRCVNPIAWKGIVAIESAPYVAPGFKLMLRIQEMNLYDPQHAKTFLAGRGFDLIKQHLIPRLQAFSYDLNPAIQQLGALARDASTPGVADRIRDALATLRVDPAPLALDDGVKITLLITLPDVPAAAPSPAPTEPTSAEIQAFEERLDQWDAFLVFAIKQLGITVGDKPFREQLLQILLESRYRLVDALRTPPAASGPDPVRSLFLDTWQNLGAAVRSAARRGQLGARGLEFLSFIAAGDALFALDQAAPALGMRVSAADLRRLAHIMAPDATGDPLQFDFEEDPGLRDLFHGNEPLSSPDEPAPESSPNPSPTLTPWSPAPSPLQSIAALAPAASPTPASYALHRAGRWLRLVLRLFEPAQAYAAEAEPSGSLLRQVAIALKRVVVDEGNAQRYRRNMQRLLELSSERELRNSDLDSRYGATFHLIVKSAAWQESCWRQFIRRGTQVTWLESSTGDIGLMQVNKYVWRGFYNIEKLKWDVLYNAGAGTQILLDITQRVLARARAEPARRDKVALARSTYAAYNGGPDADDRWRHAVGPSPEREIDAAFLAKYRALERGDSIDILSCAADPRHGAGHPQR